MFLTYSLNDEIFRILLSIPHNIVMGLNNVMFNKPPKVILHVNSQPSQQVILDVTQNSNIKFPTLVDGKWDKIQESPKS